MPAEPWGPRRVVHGLRRRWLLLRFRGDAVCCPSCGTRLRAFAPAWNRPDAICPRCGSHERHRAIELFLRARPELLEGGRRVLHFAPEYALENRLRAIPAIDYVSADLNPGAADLAADITALPLADDSFDAVLCSHVLEHVADDRAAMREIARVLSSAGSAILLVPIDHARAETYEDPAVVAPADREREFWQHDHVRLYGRDFAERLRAAGLRVEVIRVAEELGADAVERHGLQRDEQIFLCRSA